MYIILIHALAGFQFGVRLETAMVDTADTKATITDGAKIAQEKETRDEAYGASQIGPFDYCPKLGFREYWYTAIWANKVGKKPVNRQLMGEEVVFFRGENENVVALTDWCPHRGARFSNGFCEFKGTITCPYHGYTFDETGQCVAGLVESDDSPLAPKMKAQKYPTAEWNGIVFIWMGIAEPVPLEDDLPWEFKDSTLTGRRFTRVKVWEANWTEPVNQGVDNHGLYLHRGLSFWRLVHRRLLFIRKAAIQAGQVKIVEEGDNYVNVRFGAVKYGQSTYKNVGKWPRHVWWRVLPRAKGAGGGAREGDVTQKQWAGHDHNLELPSKVRVPTGTHVHLRWGVPIDEMNTWMWTFNIFRKPRNILGWLYLNIYYHLWRVPATIISVNEREDLVVFKEGRLNYELPQKLGIGDTGVIYFRRHLAKRSRDFKRLGGAYGCYKQLPDPDRVAENTRAHR